VLEINKGFGRGVWSIGHVVQTFPGPDGCVRAVYVQLPSGIFRRGITELCLLETSSAVPASGEDVSAKSQSFVLHLATTPTSSLPVILSHSVNVACYFSSCRDSQSVIH
jgi:hypothetical protein